MQTQLLLGFGVIEEAVSAFFRPLEIKIVTYEFLLAACHNVSVGAELLCGLNREEREGQG